ncbi:MAG: ATP-binding protein [Burkholderiaceae bacterium]
MNTPDRNESLASRPPARYSLQRRLLWSLGLPIIVVALLQAGLAYRAALTQADAAFDAQMKQLATAIQAGQVDSRLSASGIKELDFVVQTWSADGRIIYQSTTRRLAPARVKPGYSIAQTGDKTYRVYATGRSGVFVQVSQDLQARADKARQEAFSRTWPIALLGLFLVLLTNWVIRRALAPVDRVRQELSQRRARRLEPVDDANLPSEVQPLVRELNDLLERVSQTMQGHRDFVADAAHELRSPLTAIKLQVQNLRRTSPPAGQQTDPDTAAAVKRLEQGVDRAARMTDQLISMAREQVPLSESEPSQIVSLSELAKDVIIQLTAQADDRNIDLGMHRDDSLTITGQTDSIRVLVRNLIGNALKYTPVNGTVDVSVITENDRVCLIVEDSGPGIEASQRERVFDRFYRGHPYREHADAPGEPTIESQTNTPDTGQPEATGSGLGLAIVKAVANRHQAEVQLAKSPRLGGLRVRVQFPHLERAATA